MIILKPFGMEFGECIINFKIFFMCTTAISQ